MDERKRTKAEERANTELHDLLYEADALRHDLEVGFQRRMFDNVPSDWASVESEAPVRKRKVRITAAYDEDVAKFFRTMGLGYQARMNLVLRTYMLAMLSRHFSSRKNEDWLGREI